MNILFKFVFLVGFISAARGAKVGITDFVFNKFTDPSQTCPGFTVHFSKAFHTSKNENGTYKMDLVVVFFGREKTETLQCQINAGDSGSCYCPNSVYVGKELSKIVVYFDAFDDSGKQIIGSIENFKVKSLTQVFGPFELHTTNLNKTSSTMSWYLPYTEKCSLSNTLEGMHFKCNAGSSGVGGGSVAGDLCGKYTDMVFECGLTVPMTCTTWKKDVSFQCKKYEYFIPLDGTPANRSAKVESPYILCEMALHDLNDTSYTFQGRYTFNSHFANDEDPETYDDWSDWSNHVLVGTALTPTGPQVEAKQGHDDKSDLNVEYMLNIVFGCVLGAFVIIAVVLYVKWRRSRYESTREADENITPRNNNGHVTGNSSNSTITLSTLA